MRKVVIFFSLFLFIFFLVSFFYSFFFYKNTYNFLTTHEKILELQGHIDKISQNIDTAVNSIFQEQLPEKKPINTTEKIAKEQKHIALLIDTFKNNVESYGCQNCHEKKDVKINHLLDSLEKIRVKMDSIYYLVVQYSIDKSKRQDIIAESDVIHKYILQIEDLLKKMENNYHYLLAKSIKTYFFYFSFFSLLFFISLSTIAILFYRNFLKDFFKLSKICSNFEKDGTLENIDPNFFKSKEMQILGETITSTLNKLKENELELEQQLEEIKGMNEELQASNQQLEILTLELDETKKELERRVYEKTKELEKAYEDLKDLDKLKSNFLQNISHEFKTPLTPLFGYLKLFKNQELGQLTPLQEQSIDIMLTCAEKLYNTIEDLIFLARLNLDKEFYMMKDIDLVYLIKNIKTRVDKELEEKEIKISLDLPPFSILVKGEQLMLTQAILHLIRNAIKYTPDKGNIYIILSQEDKNAVLRIIDSGAGIPQNRLLEINKYLTSSDIHTEIKGDFITLGLNILKRVVAFHRAKVYYKSELNNGTEVIITFPIKTS